MKLWGDLFLLLGTSLGSHMKIKVDAIANEDDDDKTRRYRRVGNFFLVSSFSNESGR